MDLHGLTALSPPPGMTKRQRVIAEEETSFIHANQMKEFTLKVVNPNKKGDVAGNVFQRASTPAIAVEKVKEKHPGCNVFVVDSREDQPWRRDERY